MNTLNPLLLLLFCASALADPWYENVWADPLEKRKNLMEANNVRTTFFNTGLLGRVGPEPSFEWPAGTGNDYLGDFCMAFGSAVYNPLLARMVNSVAVTQSPGRGRDEVNPTNPAEYWTFMPLPGLAEPETSRVALRTQPFTWPEIWPDTGQSGWNSGIADGSLSPAEEAYFWMDDSRDREFLRTEWAYRENADHELWLQHFPEDPDSALVPLIQPFPGDSLHGGMGLKVAVRHYAWAETALQDVLILSYEIHNAGTLPLEASRLGFIVGTIVGGDGDSADDINQFHLEQELVICSDWDDQGVAGWEPVLPGVRNVGVVGVALLESPGAGRDWIDNDGDAAPGLPVLDATTLQGMLEDRELVQNEVAVMIDYDDPAGSRPRRLVRVPSAAEPLVVSHRGQTLTCAAGQIVRELPDNQLDDNFNGLVDEGLHQFGRAYLDWSMLGLPLPNPVESIPVPESLVQAYAPLLDERKDDGLDNDGDWNLFHDVGADGMAGTGDMGEGDGQPTAGEPHFEWRDPDEADQLGLTGFNEFTFPEFSSRNDEDIWQRMQPQSMDSTSGTPADHDCLLSCGAFSLNPGERTRLTVAVLFAVDEENLLQRLEEVQRFHDSEYTELSQAIAPPRAMPGPAKLTLADPWPNPFNPVTQVSFSLPATGPVRMRVHDCLGRQVRIMLDETLPAGEHVVRLDGSALASGLYFIQLEAAGRQEVRKCLLLR